MDNDCLTVCGCLNFVKGDLEMSKQTEALKLALEALKMCRALIRINIERLVPIESPNPWFSQDVDHAITALREALASEAIEQPAPVAEPRKQEPVAWMHVMDNTEGIKANGKGYVSITQKRKHPFGKPGIDFSKSYPVTSTPLYTSPPAQRTWVGLTDEERDDLMGNYITAEGRARAIEAKLKEKNT